MKILFDQSTPRPLKNYLYPHVVTTSFQMKWGAKENGDLIGAAEAAGFDLLITADKNWKYQQNLSGRKVAIIVLMVNDWKKIQPSVGLVQDAVAKVAAGSFIEVEFPE